MKSSIHFSDGEIAKLVKGKKISLNDGRTHHQMPVWMQKVVEAYGFPKAK